MALWDGNTLWDGSDIWGFDNPPAEVILERELFGPGIAKRRSCFEIWSVNPTTLAFETKLTLRSADGSRVVNGRNRMTQETLAFSLNDSTLRYLPGGDLASLVAVNSLLGLKWVVSNGTDETTEYGNIFRVNDPLDRERTNNGLSPLAVNALDWLRVPLNQPSIYVGGFSPLQQAILLKEDMLTAGCPVIDHPDSWATVAGAILYYLAGHRLRVSNEWRSSLHPPISAFNEMIDPMRVDALAKPPTWQGVFDFISGLSRTNAMYDPDGWPRIKEENGAIDSGLTINCDADYPARLRIPWENPISRQLSNPEYAAYEYWITYIQDTGSQPIVPTLNIPVFGQQAGTPQIGGVPIAAVFSQPVVKLQFIARAVSNTLNSPFIAGFSQARSEVVKGQYTFNVEDHTAQEYVNMMLHIALAAADVVNVPVDNAFPASKYIKQNIWIDLPNEGIRGWFRLNEIRQPLNQNPSTLTLNWDSD